MGAKKIAIYSRKSRYTGKGESIENQIELCRQYIKTHRESTTDDDIIVYEDEGFSGGNINRPQFTEMMGAARAGQISKIVCYRLDRISRNIGDFAKLVEEFSNLEISFVSIKEQFETSSPMGRAMMYIASVFSQLERETIAERIRDNMLELAKTGRWLGGITPTGYRSEQVVKHTIDGKARKLFKLAVVENEAETIKLIYKKFFETGSLTKTETYLLQNYIKSKNNRPYNRFSIRTILSNPVYAAADCAAFEYFNGTDAEIYADKCEFDGKNGIMAYNKTKQVQGKSNKTRNLREWIVSVGKHKPLVSGEEWVSVQKLLDINRGKGYRKPKSNVALLSGLLHCGNCGAYLRPKLSKSINAQGEGIYSYLCETKEKSKSHNCQIKNPGGNILDKLVCEEIKKISLDSSVVMKNLEDAKKTISLNTKEHDAAITKLKKERHSVDGEIRSLVMSLMRTEGSAAHGYIEERVNALHEQKKLLSERIDEMENITKGHSLSDIEFDIIKGLLQSFSGVFDAMPVEQKRKALRTVVRKIVWDGENAHMILFGAPENHVIF